MRSRLLFPALFFTAVASGLALWLIPSGLGPSHFNYYGLLASALREGRLWVVEARGDQCPYDLIAYRGHCYLYWGIVPSFFHWFVESDRLVTLIAGFFAVYFWLGILWQLGARPKTPVHSAYFWLLAILNPLLATVVCGWVYAEAIVVALAFGLSGFFIWLHGPPRQLTALTLLAFAALTRATWFPVLALATILAFCSSSRRWWLSLPLGLAGLIQATLNQWRFDSPFEFGVRYYQSHLTGPPGLSWTAGTYSWLAVPHNLVSYFFTASPWAFSWDLALRKPLYSEYPIALCLVLPGLAWSLIRWRKALSPHSIFFLASPLAILVLFQTTQSWRYETEAWLPLILPGMVALFSTPLNSPGARLWHGVLLTWGLGLTLWNTIAIVQSRLFQL